jgi:hypothetical protein
MKSVTMARLARAGRRLMALLVMVSLSYAAWVACASGTATTSQMACCADHHDHCDMVDATGRCCTSEHRTDHQFLVASKVLLTVKADASVLLPAVHSSARILLASSPLATRAPAAPPPVLTLPHLLNVVLLI